MLALAAIAAGGGVAGAATRQAAAAAAGCTTVKAPAPRPNGHQPKPPPIRRGKRYTAVVVTNCGTFRIALDAKQSPHAVASFVALSRAKFFDDTVFHRIVPGFVIQGGDPTQTGTGGPGYSTVDTPPRGARYVEGVVAMAKTQADPRGTAGSQFFVVTAPDAGLPPDYAIIGRVSSGLDVVRRIGRLGNPATEQPTRVVEIRSIRISDP
jgi:cyclophilin family peptidyl-prolyl cis-trans isomerase